MLMLRLQRQNKGRACNRSELTVNIIKIAPQGSNGKAATTSRSAASLTLAESKAHLLSRSRSVSDIHWG